MSNPHLYGQILLVEVPVITTFIGAFVAWWVRRVLARSDARNAEVAKTLGDQSKTLQDQSQALALLLREVLPEGGPSLSDRLDGVTREVAVIKDRQSRRIQSEQNSS